MTLEDLYNVLNSISGFENKVTYRAWPEGMAPELPFICYLVSNTDNFMADGVVYRAITEVDIELYTENKDLTSEKLIEDALFSAGITWEKEEEYIDTEHCFEIIYTITI